MIYSFLMLFFHMMQSVLFVNELFTTIMTFYNWMMMYVPSMIY